ncbi:hypothetical protein LTR04_006425 [Oleoguttula sp. CCFEE 6159]|nr:hypothetical protein LTR04_006425 [Oleoguttula sp. CCFEE 6159]
MKLLHAAYAVESFLRGLVQRKCNFHIAFFDQHQKLCIPGRANEARRAKYLLARATVIRHLQANLPGVYPSIKVSIFESITSTEFEIYLKESGMYFLMCHDGASPVPHFPPRKTRRGTDKTDHSRGMRLSKSGRAHRAIFRAMVLRFIGQGYNVALVNGLEWRDTKVMTMVLEGYRSSGLPVDQLQVKQLKKPIQGTPISSETWNNFASLLESGEHSMEESSLLAICTLAEMLAKDDTKAELTSAFLLHTALLHVLPVSDRRMSAVPASKPTQEFLLEFAETAAAILQYVPGWSEVMASAAPVCDVVDLVDGRIFNAMIGALKTGLDVKAMGETFAQKAVDLFKAAYSLRGMKLSLPSASGHKRQEPNKTNGHTSKPSAIVGVMPFSNSVFDKHLASIQLSVDSSGSMGPDNRAVRVFKELSHWHNAKRPMIARGPKVIGRGSDEFWALRRNQWFMAEMRTYAASLTNAVGKSLDPETVVVGGTKASSKSFHMAKVESSDSDSKISKGKAPTNKKPGKNAAKQAMLENIAANAAKKEEGNTDKTIRAWHVICKNLEAEADLIDRYAMSKAYVNSLDTGKRAVLGAEVELYMLNALLGLWIDFCRRFKKEEGYGIAALIWDTVTRLSKVKRGMTKTIAMSIQETSRTLDLPFVTISVPSDDRKLPFTFVLPLPKDEALSVDLSAREFQLLHCGPYFDRSIDSSSDSRVPFEPDGWQKKVLDEIDARRSLFVVAPTSAGKTFISFYAMKQVLESDDDDVLVYVAPTKALVNQIAAEVQARFSKSFKYPGKSVWAIHTRDHRINSPTGCQVLVTVPHVLQIMLLAPSNANSWARRVKRIIFDEVHSIGQAEDGVVWEQLLLLAPCPIIALSATVGNPEEFSSWLSSTQESIGNKLTMVQHPHRYSDLRKFVYVPPKRFFFKGLTERTSFGNLGLDGAPGFAYMHPVASLVNKSRGMPDDLNLEPRDCFLLWRCMVKHQNENFPVDQSLDPAKSLPEVVRKMDIIHWEQGLKKILRAWMTDEASPFDKVMEELSKPIHNVKPDDIQASSGSIMDGEEPREVNPDNLRSTTLPLLSKLHEQDALPAILFNYDRSRCEDIARAVMDQLKSSEEEWKNSSPKWKKKLEGFEQWKKEQEKKTFRKVKVNRKKAAKSKRGEDDDGEPEDESEKLTKADLAKDAASVDISPFATFDPDAPVEGFHFANHKRLQGSELAMYVRQLGKRGINPWLIEALTRGIGVHHAGMNRKYRQVVEMLFRKGFLRVVIATGTLALGINMPCKTVVFSGDSVFLTALNFRQAAGRAGRRGFDMLGNVVFQGISLGKVCRLISSRLPDLNGHFPITTTLVLRLFTLLHESRNSQYAQKAIGSLLSQPRLFMGSSERKAEVLHHLRFSIEYLRRQFLLDSKGTPLNFAGCVSHLYFTENSSFAFHALLKEGYFHQLCAKIEEKPTETIRTLMLVMAHLFGRRECRQADQEFVDQVIKRSPSVVFLPPLPKKAAAVLRAHNDETLGIFSTYVKTFVDQHVKSEDCYLPLTRVKVGGDESLEVNAVLPSLPSTAIRSAFVALSGHGDDFESISDLCSTSREGVFLEESVIPHVALYPDETDSPLNAYLYDFFMHGDVTALDKANGIKRGDVWFLLNDFSMVLATLITSLMNFMKLSPGTDMDMLDVMGNLDAHEEAEDDKIVNAESPASTLPIMEKAQQSAVPVVKKKTKAVDDWEEAADDEEAKAAKNRTNGSNGVDDLGAAAWDKDSDEGLMRVLRAFQKLNTEFNTKFKAMWA